MREQIVEMIRLHDPELAEDETDLSVLVHQILVVFRKEIEKVANPNKELDSERAEYGEWLLSWTAKWAFEQCRQKILDLLEERR